MIERRTEQDKDGLLELCLITHPMREHPFLEQYFDYVDELDTGLFIKEEDQPVACMQMREHKIHMKGKILLSSFIFGVATHVDYRQRGYMDKLMNMMLDISGKNYLISFIEAYNPKLYKKYGFETISYRKKLSISRKEIKVKNIKGISKEVSYAELVQLYKEFSSVFDCFYLRDEAYYENYINLAKHSGGKLVAYRDENSKLMGYCLYYEKDDMVEVKEIIYLDSRTLMKLLHHAIGPMSYISVEVSNGEKLEKLFKQAIPRESACVMGRINNYTLFNKLYDTRVKSVSEAFKQMKKPILINEKN